MIPVTKTLLFRVIMTGPLLPEGRVNPVTFVQTFCPSWSISVESSQLPGEYPPVTKNT